MALFLKVFNTIFTYFSFLHKKIFRFIVSQKKILKYNLKKMLIMLFIGLFFYWGLRENHRKHTAVDYMF